LFDVRDLVIYGMLAQRHVELAPVLGSKSIRSEKPGLVLSERVRRRQEVIHRHLVAYDRVGNIGEFHAGIIGGGPVAIAPAQTHRCSLAARKDPLLITGDKRLQRDPGMGPRALSPAAYVERWLSRRA
jgi:hypothetical protein